MLPTTSSQVLLFKGTGAGPFCTEALENKLAHLLDPRFYVVNTIASFPDSFSDPASISAVYVPGGNAAQMLYSISSDAKSSLQGLFKKYQTAYYGACAGGILATSGCFETRPLSTHLECMRKNSYPLLEIFPGKVVAPIFPKPVDGKLHLMDFRSLVIHTAKTTSQMLTAHILSPGYLDVDQVQGAEILSTYDAVATIRSATERDELGDVINPSRISESLFFQEGDSKMILTGSHPEVDSKAILSPKFKAAFSATNEEQQRISLQMAADDAARERLLSQHFQRIGLRCRV